MAHLKKPRYEHMDGSPDLWDETHVLKVLASNPSTIYWMDIFHIYLL